MDKAHYGHPCNHCGLCCQNEPCPIGTYLFSIRVGACPALTDSGCDLVPSPAKYFPAAIDRYGVQKVTAAIKFLIGTGRGCDAKVDGEPDPPASYKRAVRLMKTGRMQRRGQRYWRMLQHADQT